MLMLAAVGVIGWFDVYTGPDYGMSLFYLAPVGLTAWHVGLRASVGLAIVAAILWYSSELLTHSGVSLEVASWNGFTRLVIYMGSAITLALLRADRTRMRELLALAESSARTDSLTGLANSRAFYERLHDEIPRLQRYDRPVTIAYVDVDNFKRVNDRFGHARGDEVLKEIAGVLRSTVRASDLAARLGGDEFALAMWDTAGDHARAFEERLAAALAPLLERYPDTGLGASVGWATLRAGATVDDVVHAADEAMYAAKAARKARASAPPS